MAHNYQTTSATYIPGSSTDPIVTVIGSVDTIPVTFTLYLSVITNTFAQSGNPGLIALVSPIMLALAFPPQPTPPANLQTGSWSI
jgi:hypothetical protein